MNAQVIRKIIHDPDLRGATAALQRAAARANWPRKRARLATSCVKGISWTC